MLLPPVESGKPEAPTLRDPYACVDPNTGPAPVVLPPISACVGVARAPIAAQKALSMERRRPAPGHASTTRPTPTRRAGYRRPQPHHRDSLFQRHGHCTRTGNRKPDTDPNGVTRAESLQRPLECRHVHRRQRRLRARRLQLAVRHDGRDPLCPSTTHRARPRYRSDRSVGLAAEHDIRRSAAGVRPRRFCLHELLRDHACALILRSGNHPEGLRDVQPGLHSGVADFLSAERQRRDGRI